MCVFTHTAERIMRISLNYLQSLQSSMGRRRRIRRSPDDQPDSGGHEYHSCRPATLQSNDPILPAAEFAGTQAAGRRAPRPRRRPVRPAPDDNCSAAAESCRDMSTTNTPPRHRHPHERRAGATTTAKPAHCLCLHCPELASSTSSPSYKHSTTTVLQ